MNGFMKDLDSEARLGEVGREEEPRRGSPPDEHSSAELAAPEPANRISMTKIDNHRSRKATVVTKDLVETEVVHLGFVLVRNGTCSRGVVRLRS